MVEVKTNYLIEEIPKDGHRFGCQQRNRRLNFNRTKRSGE